ncbi:MAG: hypothetical protein IKV15_03250 [Bacteroidaceae bacterium]|nr:hypothetical protein [Bacteroidaceae bacterium]
MKTIHDELEELGTIMDATTEENDTRYQEKFLYIKANYSTKEDAEVIADFILRRNDALGEKVEEFKKQLDMLEQ